MNFRLAATTLALLAGTALPSHAQTEIQWWHSMGGALGEWVTDLTNEFNASQKDYKVVPTFKGAYDQSMTAAIAAFRAGNAPHILQVFEVGTATMMASKGAIVPVGQVMKDAGYKFDTGVYVPAVAGYYTAANGQMLSFPFNSSTTVFFYNKDAFKAAGLDPEKAPGTWPEVALAAAKLKASGSKCPYTTSWQGWVQLESFSAWHNTLYATKNNGFGGLDTRLVFNTPLHVRHIENLANMSKQGLFAYKGRGNAADATFTSGECAMFTGSSSLYGSVAKAAKFGYGMAPLPYYPDVPGAPQNTVIGGQEGARVQGRGSVLQLPVGHRGAGQEPSAHRLSADHQGRVRRHRQERLLQEEPGYRRGGQPDDPQDHRQVARHPAGQHAADPHRGRRRAGTGLVGQEGTEGSAGRGGEARQRVAGTLRKSQQVLN
jgi:sn-glycerol 3-phosphate transport system substrate-binding protein